MCNHPLGNESLVESTETAQWLVLFTTFCLILTDGKGVTQFTGREGQVIWVEAEGQVRSSSL